MTKKYLVIALALVSPVLADRPLPTCPACEAGKFNSTVSLVDENTSVVPVRREERDKHRLRTVRVLVCSRGHNWTEATEYRRKCKDARCEEFDETETKTTGKVNRVRTR